MGYAVAVVDDHGTVTRVVVGFDLEKLTYLWTQEMRKHFREEEGRDMPFEWDWRQVHAEYEIWVQEREGAGRVQWLESEHI